MLLEQHRRHIGHPHRHARVAGIRCLDPVHGQRPDGGGAEEVIRVKLFQRRDVQGHVPHAGQVICGVDSTPFAERKAARRGVRAKGGESPVAITYCAFNDRGRGSESPARSDWQPGTKMSNISDFERRITTALDRASQAMDQLSAGGEGDTTALTAELEAERVANQQLEERVRAIKEKQETMVAGLEEDVARLREALKARDAEVQQMRSVNQNLRDSNAALREANAQGLAEPELVNTAMVTELESLRAARDAERAEIEDILATLEPVLKEA